MRMKTHISSSKGWLMLSVAVLLAVTLVESAKLISESPEKPVPSRKTLLVEIYSTKSMCLKAKVNFDVLLMDIVQISLSYTDMVVVLAVDCSTRYLKYSVEHANPAETAVVKFSSNEDGQLPQNTTDMFEDIREKIQEHFATFNIEYDLTVREIFFHTNHSIP